ncbi:MAG: glycerophosphodiester phosphodiesterase family protein [Anaerococcus sp.]|nr:glycerophosphodiester phosphodiesterase family protein [Peptoniphilaceae bacterium]MDY3054930.1 glycerophosphodiester phosphodiesterase family protein [Anaerococcus sp.]
MDIYAHRGYSSKYLENTKDAFKACLDLDITGIELDVQVSKDGEVVVFHDENIKRLTGKDAFLKDLTLKELQELKFKDGQTFITLDDYLDIAENSQLITNVELKTGKFSYEGIEEMVYQKFKERSMLDRLMISSFNHKSLVNFKKLDENIPLAALFSKIETIDEDYLDQNGIKIYHPNHKYLSFSDIKRLKAKGIKINLWTVNDRFEYIKNELYGVEGIITNSPEMK